MRTTFGVAISGLLVCFLIVFNSMAKAPGPVVQPTEIPGNWKLVDNPLPSLESVIAKPAAEMPVYGLYGWCGEYKKFRADILKVGYRSVRISGPMHDEVMEMMVEDGVEVMKTLAARTFTLSREKKTRNDYESDEAYIEAYLKGLEGFMNRYGPNGTFFKERPNLPHRPIVYIEIFNEPNFQYMIPPSKEVSRADQLSQKVSIYARMLPAAYKLIKAKWPEVTVLGFATGGAAGGDVPFIEKVHEANNKIGESYDILSTHPYTRPVPAELFSVKKWGGYSTVNNFDRIRKAMSSAGGSDKPIWYTEVGWAINHADGGRFDDSKAKGPFISPDLHAAYIVRLYALSMRLGVERVHIMHATDTDRFNGGIFTFDGKWRPATYATQFMIKLMPNPKLMGAVHDDEDGLYAYQFDADHTDGHAKQVLMTWDVTGPKTVDLPVSGDGQATVFDMVGNGKTVDIVDGKVRVKIGPCPVYVLAD